MVGIQVWIHIEQFAERYLSAHAFQIHSRSIITADLQIGDIERAIITIAIASDKVGQLPLRCGQRNTLTYFDFIWESQKGEKVLRGVS